jgi:hypothetical protein
MLWWLNKLTFKNHEEKPVTIVLEIPMEKIRLISKGLARRFPEGNSSLEVMDGLRCIYNVVDYYGIDDELALRIEQSYQLMVEEGLVSSEELDK